MPPNSGEWAALRDGIEEGGWESHRPKLTYPFEAAPKTGEAVDIAPGVKWLRMPLGGSLAWINVWAIADDDGWAIVDTGISGVETRNAWRAALKGPLEGKPVTRVFVTHMHPDHIGMSGYLTRKFDARLWITRLEFVTCRSLAADTGREAPEDAIVFFRGAGWDEEALETYRARAGEIDLVVLDLGMPGMGGQRCLEAILALNPRAKVVIASGYAADGQVRASLQGGAAGFVAKPYRRRDLLMMVREALDK
jgi:CheY-like chemotaxis protein